MMRRAIVVAVLALLLILGGVMILVLRPWASSGDEAQPSPPPSPVAKQARPAPPQPVDLGAVLGLQSLVDCSQSPVLASVLEQMVRIDPRTFESRRGGPIGIPGYDRPLVPTFERIRETGANLDIRAVTADLGLSGRWQGLAVTGLRRSFYEESDAGSFEIRFADPPERVRETLVRNGFSLPPVGELRDAGDEPGITVAIGVERIEGGAALICATG